jgi:hypothetical protein
MHSTRIDVCNFDRMWVVSSARGWCRHPGPTTRPFYPLSLSVAAVVGFSVLVRGIIAPAAYNRGIRVWYQASRTSSKPSYSACHKLGGTGCQKFEAAVVPVRRDPAPRSPHSSRACRVHSRRIAIAGKLWPDSMRRRSPGEPVGPQAEASAWRVLINEGDVVIGHAAGIKSWDPATPRVLQTRGLTVAQFDRRVSECM